MKYTPRPKYIYKKEIVPFLMSKFKYKSIMQVPKLKKIVLNQGLGFAINDKKIIDHAVKELTSITGQFAVSCVSKKDESGFKLRKNTPIGCKVTLRRDKMYEFLDRLVTVALPRVRDFRGLKDNSFDGRGNYNMGISEQIIFPEINIDQIKKICGMNITFVTSAKNDIEAKFLLLKFGFPFKKI